VPAAAYLANWRSIDYGVDGNTKVIVTMIAAALGDKLAATKRGGQESGPNFDRFNQLNRGPYRGLTILFGSSTRKIRDFLVAFRRPQRPPFRVRGVAGFQKFANFCFFGVQTIG
jgi:hypothetical protein